MSDATQQHPRHRLDDLLTSGVRLSIVAALDGVDRVEFAAVRDGVEVSDSVLSKHVAALERAGYVRVEKGRAGRRPRTWIAVTPTGSEAFRAHLRAVRDIASHDLACREPSSGDADSPGLAGVAPGRVPDALRPA